MNDLHMMTYELGDWEWSLLKVESYNQPIRRSWHAYRIYPTYAQMVGEMNFAVPLNAQMMWHFA